MGSTKLLVLLLTATLAVSSANGLKLGWPKGEVEGCVINCFRGGYFQHPSDCSKFIQCAPAGPEVMDCAEGTIWSQKKLTCEHIGRIPCETGSYLTSDGQPCSGEPQPPTESPKPPTHPPQPPTEPPKPPTQPPQPSTQPPKPPTQPPQRPTVPTQSPQPPTEEPAPPQSTEVPKPPTAVTTVEPVNPVTPGECDFKCPKFAGIFPHPRDCSRFFLCKFRMAKEIKCPFGLEFNPYTKLCTLKCLSHCKATPDAPCS